MSRIARVTGCLIVLCGLASLLSCSTSTPDNAADTADKRRIAVIPKGTTHDFWRSVHAGALKAEREINGGGAPKVEVIWKGPQKEDDRALQIQVVQNFIAAGVKGIVLAPLDDTALLSPVQDCGRAGIPVAIIDSGLKGEAGKDFVSYI